MSIQVKAVYENGIFRPLQAVDLAERQEVTVTISNNGDGSEQVLFTLPTERWDKFCEALDSPPRAIPALHKLLTEASVLDVANAANRPSAA